MANIFQRVADAIWKMTPFLPKEELETVSDTETYRQTKEAIAEMARQQQSMMHMEHAALGKMNGSIEHKAVEGMGEKIGSIPMATYMQMRREYGDECWSDPAFVREFLRDNPGCRVKVTRGTKGQLY